MAIYKSISAQKAYNLPHHLSHQNTHLCTIFKDKLYVTIFCNYVSYCPCNSLLINHYFHCLQLCFVNIVGLGDYEQIKF